MRRWPRLRLSDASPAWNRNPVYRGLSSLALRPADIELVAANEGLGFRIVRAQKFLQIDQIFVVLITIGLLGLLMAQRLLDRERALQEALVTTQRVTEEMKESARREAAGSSVIAPPRKLSGSSRPRTRLASVTVGSTPPWS